MNKLNSYLVSCDIEFCEDNTRGWRCATGQEVQCQDRMYIKILAEVRSELPGCFLC
jgi:hypothetical protein